MTIYNRPAADVPVWAESGDKVQPTNPEVQTGWPLSNVPPSRQRFNWILNACAQAVRYVLQRGIAQWAAGEDYPENGRVQYNGLTFRALIDSPTSFPGDVPGEWEAWGYSDSTLLPRVDSILTKSVAGGVDVVLTAAEANNGILVFTGVITANINVVIPNAARRFAVYNGTTGAFTLGIKTAAGASLVISQGTSQSVYCDGANTVRVAAGLVPEAATVTPAMLSTGGPTWTDNASWRDLEIIKGGGRLRIRVWNSGNLNQIWSRNAADNAYVPMLYTALTHEFNAGVSGNITALSIDANGIITAPSLVAPGAVMAFAMSTSPAGWLKCNGAAVSRTTYAALFTAIGTTYGAGDGSTTFNLPDLRGEFVRGWDDGRGVDSGRALGSAQSHQMQSHTHTYTGGAVGGLGYNTGSSANGTGTSNTGSAGGTSNGSETRPRNVALLYCIKY